MKTTVDKIKESTLPLLVLAIIITLLMIINCVSSILDAVQNQTEVVTTANYIGNAVDCVFFTISAFIAVLLLKNIIKTGTPFDNKNVKLIKSIGVMTLIQGVVSPAIRAVFLGIFHSDVTYSSNSALLFLGIIICYIAKIFSYGEMLQQESDETI